MSTEISTNESSKFEMILHSAMELPGIKINRTEFLRKELIKYFDGITVEKAIKTNPAQAGIKVSDLDRIAAGCINFETAKVTALSTAAGIPGGAAMIATVPADIAQFFGHVIRILQKLVYLYGWQEIFSDENTINDEAANQIMLFIGVMFGVNVANATINKIAQGAALHAEKTLVRKALTQGTIYPIVKKIATYINVQMTKDLFAKGVGKAIPIIGAGISGVVTFASFKPMCKKLQKYLITLPMADTDFYKKVHPDIIDIDLDDISLSE